MSQEDVEAVRRASEAAFGGDVEGFVAWCHPDVEWEENTPVFPGLERRYHGHDGVRRWFSEAIAEPWSELQIEVAEFRETSHGCVLAETTFRARGKLSGVETRLRFWQVLWLTDAKIARRQLFLSEEDALEAAAPGA